MRKVFLAMGFIVCSFGACAAFAEDRLTHNCVDTEVRYGKLWVINNCGIDIGFNFITPSGGCSLTTIDGFYGEIDGCLVWMYPGFEGTFLGPGENFVKNAYCDWEYARSGRCDGIPLKK